MSDMDPANRDRNLGPPEYLVYRVLLEMDRKDGQQTSRTRIHKLCCLVDRRLKEQYGRDIGLPTHWYMYGRVVEEALIDRSVIFQGKAAHFSGNAYYPADQIRDSDFEHLEAELKDDISRAVLEVIDDHGAKSAEELREYQYREFAPNDFVRAYGDLRWHLQLIQDRQPDVTFSLFLPPDEKSRIERMLDEMLVAFDAENNSEIYELYLDWDDTFRMMNEMGRSPRELLEFLEMFIEAVAKLGFRFEDHAHITDGRLEEWERENDEIERDLVNEIQRKRNEALEQRAYGESLERVSEAYNDAIFDELED